MTDRQTDELSLIHIVFLSSDTEIRGDILFLGYYESEFDWSNETAKVKLQFLNYGPNKIYLLYSTLYYLIVLIPSITVKRNQLSVFEMQKMTKDL